MICVVVWQKPVQHCKTIFLQLKNKFNLKNGREEINPFSHPEPGRIAPVSNPMRSFLGLALLGELGCVCVCVCVTFPLVLEKDSRGTNVSLWSLVFEGRFRAKKPDFDRINQFLGGQ